MEVINKLMENNITFTYADGTVGIPLEELERLIECIARECRQQNCS